MNNITIANSNIGHNLYSLLFFAELERNPSFMSSLSKYDRAQLSGIRNPNDSLKTWQQLSPAQRAFMQGGNMPDAVTWMWYTHTVNPQGFIRAAYLLSSESEKTMGIRGNNKGYLKYMAMGMRLHVVGDLDEHPELRNLAPSDHVRYEKARDIKRRDLATTILGITPKEYDDFRSLTEEISGWTSPNIDGGDYRDKFLNILQNHLGMSNMDSRSLSYASEFPAYLKGALSATPAYDSIPPNYQTIDRERIRAVFRAIDGIPITTPPTDDMIENQRNLDTGELINVPHYEGGSFIGILIMLFIMLYIWRWCLRLMRYFFWSILY